MKEVDLLLQQLTYCYIKKEGMTPKQSISIPDRVWETVQKHPTFHTLCAISKLLSSNAPQCSDLLHRVFLGPSLEEDDRVEIDKVIKHLEANIANCQNQPKFTKLKSNVDRMVVVVLKEDLVDNEDGTYTLTANPLSKRNIWINGNKYRISDSRFLNQPSLAALGTGFFVDTNTILTAAHVVFPAFRNVKLEDIRFVKGYTITENHEPTLIEKKDVFKAIEEKEDLRYRIDYELSSYGPDWIKLKVIKEESGAALSHLPPIAVGEPLPKQHVYGLGYGLGLPLKMSYCGNVISSSISSKDELFQCTLDFYSGNSGSPVFDSETHQLVGILVRGNREFYFNEDQGERTVKLAVFSQHNLGEECQIVKHLFPEELSILA